MAGSGRDTGYRDNIDQWRKAIDCSQKLLQEGIPIGGSATASLRLMYSRSSAGSPPGGIRDNPNIDRKVNIQAGVDLPKP